MVLDVPVEEMLTPSSATAAPPEGIVDNSGKWEDPVGTAVSPPGDLLLPLLGEILLMTVPTACKVLPVNDCLLVDGADEAAEDLEVEAGEVVEWPVTGLMMAAHSWDSRGAGFSHTIPVSRVGRRFT